MNQDQQNFESVRRLLALKRHEVPPPGYFNNFSRQVLARIRAGEAEESAGMVAAMPWLFSWLQKLETKPVFAGGFATALCLLLIFGAVLAQRPETSAQAQAFFQSTPHEATSMPMVAVGTPMAFAQSPGQMMEENSTNPMVSFHFQNASMQGGQMPSPQFLTFPVSGN